MTNAATSTAIMDAAKRHIRIGGLNGFSFRDIAAEVGVKSSSVHYHFPTKEKLAAQVVHQYTDELAAKVDQAYLAGSNPVRFWAQTFRATSFDADKRMCPCIVLGATARGLPPEVAAEVRRFFTMCREKIVAQGLSINDATELLARLIGAQIFATAVDDVAAYDRATRTLTT